jgi:hypothetical protein
MQPSRRLWCDTPSDFVVDRLLRPTTSALTTKGAGVRKIVAVEYVTVDGVNTLLPHNCLGTVLAAD